MASYVLNPAAVARARRLIDARQYVLDSDWGDVQPGPELDALLAAVREDGLHGELVALVSRLPATEMKEFAARLAPAAGEELLETLTAAAQDAELDALHDALAAA